MLYPTLSVAQNEVLKNKPMVSAILNKDSLARAEAQRDSLAKVLVEKDSVGIIKGNIKSEKSRKDYFVQGGDVSVDLVGLFMRMTSCKFSQMEIAGRVNLKGKLFPLFEFGLAKSHREGGSKNNVFETQAPYFRVGFDINMNKKRYNKNRFMIGFRLGYSKFTYDFTAEGQVDPVWGTRQDVNMTGLDGSALWGEGVLGFETRIWRFIHLGWNGRYKFRFTQKSYEYGEPWYVPGYGPNGTNCWGGTVNVIFEFGR